MTYLDLHCHSMFSDGACSVESLINQARARGISGLAITDHDSLTQLSSVRKIAREQGFPVLAGIEATAFDFQTHRKVHILGFGLQSTADESGPLERLVAQTREARTANTLWQAWRLKRANAMFEGREVDFDELMNVSRASTSVFKQHLMWSITELPYTDERYQAFYRAHFKNGGIAERDISYPAATDVVRAICEQGGIAVLAHPGQMDSWGMVPALVEAGISGIEAHHPDHTEDDVGRAKLLARQYGLFITGGSDYHGIYGNPPTLGCCGLAQGEVDARVADLFARETKLN